MTPIVRTDEIHSANWQLRLGELGGVVEDLQDIDQCIRIILTTPRGSLAHRTDFGCDVWLYLDWPLTEARPQLIREIIDAIGRWEKRVVVTAVEVVLGESAGDLLVTIVRRLRGEQEEGTTVVRLAA